MSLPTLESSAFFVRLWTDYTVEVPASVEVVRARMFDVDRWPEWTPGLRAIHRSRRKPVRVDTRFWMVLQLPKGPALHVPCQMLVVRDDVLEWGGGLLGSMIRHRFELAALPGGGTAIRQVEYATNGLALLLRPFERIFRAHDERWSRAAQAKLSRPN